METTVVGQDILGFGAYDLGVDTHTHTHAVQ